MRSQSVVLVCWTPAGQWIFWALECRGPLLPILHSSAVFLDCTRLISHKVRVSKITEVSYTPLPYHLKQK